MSEANGFAHMVYFTLKDNSQENVDALMAGCAKYLDDHPGTLHFSVGSLAAEMQREVNDRDFDVALNVVFRSKDDHDVYQVHQRHLDFIETFKGMWANVRVFDSHLSEWDQA